MKKKRLFVSVMLTGVMVFSMSAVAMPLDYASAAASGEVTMYRLYNPNSGEHFYTKNASERSTLKGAGWKDEGEGWIAPEKSNTPVYRLYNPIAGDHHYTMSKAEHDNLVFHGWNSEGIGWYSDDAKSIPLYREYNPNAVAGTHNYTTDRSEHNYLVSVGWKDEGIGWYGVSTDVLNSISLSEASVDLNVGKTKTLKVIYNPINYVGDSKVTWTSTDTSVVSVNNEGVITAISEGKATITASLIDKSASCAVNVKPKSGLDIVKEYVTTNGKRYTNNYSCYLEQGGHGLGISWFDNDNLMFIDDYVYDGMRIMPCINIDVNKDWIVSFISIEFSDSQFVVCSDIDKSYNAVKDDLSFWFYTGDEDVYNALNYDTVNNAANASLRLAFPYWNDMLSNMGTNMKDVAFPNYSGF